MPVKQAIFTSVRNSGRCGYQLACRSPAVSAEESRQLSLWGPSHDSLLQTDGVSVNCFTLQDGALAVSRSVADGPEYSGRRGPRIYTHYLIVPHDELERFASNPFAMLRAADEQSLLKTHETVPRSLPDVHLSGQAPIVDKQVVLRVTQEIGARSLALLVQAALDGPALAISHADHFSVEAEEVLEAVLNCVPREMRGSLPLTSGLIYSPRRPFRVMTAPQDRAEQRRMVRLGNVRIVDPATWDAGEECRGWAKLICDVVENDEVMALSAQLTRSHSGLSVEELDELGPIYWDQMRQWQMSRPASDGEASPTYDPRQAAVRAHGAHASATTPYHALADQVDQSEAAATASTEGETLPTASLERLELLDDLVFDAINGKPGALERLQQQWEMLIVGVDASQLDQSREQYLRRAVAVWTDASENGGVSDPLRVAAVLDVLSLLLEEM